LGWEVLFSLDDEKMRPTPDDLGISVRKTEIREFWSSERMRKAFGAEFRWLPSALDRN